jgi:hypothetical protein
MRLSVDSNDDSSVLLVATGQNRGSSRELRELPCGRMPCAERVSHAASPCGLPILLSSACYECFIFSRQRASAHRTRLLAQKAGGQLVSRESTAPIDRIAPRLLPVNGRNTNLWMGQPLWQCFLYSGRHIVMFNCYEYRTWSSLVCILLRWNRLTQR